MSFRISGDPLQVYGGDGEEGVDVADGGVGVEVLDGLEVEGGLQGVLETLGLGEGLVEGEDARKSLPVLGDRGHGPGDLIKITRDCQAIAALVLYRSFGDLSVAAVRFALGKLALTGDQGKMLQFLMRQMMGKPPNSVVGDVAGDEGGVRIEDWLEKVKTMADGTQEVVRSVTTRERKKKKGKAGRVKVHKIKTETETERVE